MTHIDNTTQVEIVNISYISILYVFSLSDRCNSSTCMCCSPYAVREVNDKLMNLHRSFLDPEGLPGRGMFKYVYDILYFAIYESSDHLTAKMYSTSYL